MTISGKHTFSSSKRAVTRTAAFELLLTNIKRDGEIELPIASCYSMAPLIAQGSTVTVLYTRLKDVNIGDIVVFQSETGLIGHRCIHISDDFLMTKGDNLSECDSQLVTSQVLIGKIVAVKCGRSFLNLDSDEWKRKNRKIAMISLLQSKLSEMCLQVESKKNRLLAPLAWIFRRSCFYIYKFPLFILIKYVPSRKA